MQSIPKPNLDDPRLGTLIQEGLDGNISIIGFPHELGAIRAEKPVGQEYGPDCLRRFLPKAGPTYNPEYDKDLTKLQITDYGNIENPEDPSLENLLSKLSAKVSRALEKSSIPFVIGGSKDISYGCLSGIKNAQGKENSKTSLISLQKFCDKEGDFHIKNIDQDCPVKVFLAEEKEGAENLRILYFGTEKYDNDSGTNKFKTLYQNQLSFLHLEDIRKSEVPDLAQSLGNPITQGGNIYKQQSEEFVQNCENCHLAISLEVLNSADCPGVPKPQKYGLSSEEIIEIMYQSGTNKKIASVSISDYNPRTEDWRTGRLISNMFYYFLLGYLER